MQSGWFTPVDAYCERLDPGLLAEPLNAISNIAFFIAAWLAWRYGAQRGLHTRSSLWMVFMLAIVGVGSTLFHTFANVWSELADTTPIYIFQLSLVFLYGTALGAFKGAPRPALWGLGLLCLFIATVALFMLMPGHWLNGSVGYLPGFLFLFLLGLHQRKLNMPERSAFLTASLLFGLSLIARSLDHALCSHIPTGLHFIWHGINGAVLYFSVLGYMGLGYMGVNRASCSTHL